MSLLSKYRKYLRDEFLTRLERKTGWGKEELKREFTESELVAATKILEEEESKS